MAEWQPAPFALDDPEVVRERVAAAFGGLYDRWFAQEEGVNHALPIELRAYRKVEPWGVGLLLTPWMLARLWLAETNPGLYVQSGWAAEDRADSDPVVVGPTLRFEAMGTDQRAHLNYHTELGHYLIQPLIQNMVGFAEAREVYEAWEQVIAHRDQVAADQGKECTWQREVSRREFLFRRR